MSTYSTTKLAFASRFFKALPAVPLHRPVASSKSSSSAGKPVLPLSTSDALDEEDDFTDADLLLECSFAALWNTACLLYLLQPSTSSRELEWGSIGGFVAALVVLIALPLLIGLSAGASALSEGRDVPRWMMPVAKIATGGCFFGGWALWYFVFRDQNIWLVLDTALVLLLGQGILIYRSGHPQGQIRLTAEDDEAVEEKVLVA
ncbi:hypothetical protein BCR35DRAFT_315270 [Leucosporidium creatinivorum]|uniref:Uncharacterized protein n=1 Tax=Leucosporidium creatinivorum TaxID=106004 RepID=A0A1Y2EF33_9BASI|nr:hypothetical protein BCR35DRAFT_315270 [Leucosporidium creatinivorum]